MQKCVYCGSNSLSVSDIVPDCLTNAKLRAKIVCPIEHNNRFSDAFESKASSKFAYIANLAGIKDAKSGLYPEYSFSYVLNGIEYPAKSRKMFPSMADRIISGPDGNKIGPLSSLSKIPTNTGNKVSVLKETDPATTDCRIKLSGSYQDFESTEVFRLIGKIIYEWIYFREGFDEPVNSLTSLSNFVTQGTGQINIKLIWDPSFYEKLVVPIPLGNHCLALFINKKEIYCCISLFGFVAYLIDIGSQEKIQIPDAFLFDYLDNTSGKVLPLKYPNEASFNENYEKAMTNNCIEKGGTVCYSNELTTTMNAARQLPAFINNIVWEDVSPEKKNRLLGSRLEEFRSYAFVNPHQLKRFCEEKKEDTKNGIVLDSRADNSDEIFLLFLVFRIGQGAKEKIDPLEISDLIDASCQKDNGGNPVLGPNDIDAMKKTIMETPNKEMIIERGMEIIQKS